MHNNYGVGIFSTPHDQLVLLPQIVAVFSSLHEEAIAAPCCCLVSMVVWLAGSPVTIIPAPPFGVPAVAEPSMWMMNRVFRCLMNDR